jgi:hypothetical protein
VLSIRELQRAQSSSHNKISVGDIVILKNDSTTRVFWKLAKIESLITSNDNVVRSARVKVLDKENMKIIILRRPIQHLIPLEIQSESDKPEKVEEQPKDVQLSTENATQPKRNAAILGELKRKKRIGR